MSERIPFEDQTMPEPMSGCLIWMGALHEKSGYGLTKNDERKMVYAHRLSYERARGTIKEGLQIDHLCRVRSCVNPNHLEAVSPRENVLRSNSPCAHNAKKTHCINGHELIGENLMILQEKRQCRICARARYRKWSPKRKKVIA